MNTEKILSGHELVAKGATKIEVTLPEIGLKDIFPSGSWLEQKQIQASLEARKHLIEVERIEKSGSLSHAVWREELMLAEVTQKVGSYWQYLGHNKGKLLFLEPEEALFLMEINCLHLKHNDVKVSLQQAYSLLLKGKITLLKYKVYASLSRLGFRVYRHESTELNVTKKNDSILPHIETVNNADDKAMDENNQKNVENNHVKEEKFAVNDESKSSCIQSSENIEIDETPSEGNAINQIEVEYIPTNSSISNNHKRNKNLYGIKKLQKLKNRKLLPCNERNIRKFFESLPELTDKKVVFIKAPKQQYIPKSINLQRTNYNINLENINSKNVRSVSVDTNIYSVDDEVNDRHVRRIRNTSTLNMTPPLPLHTSFGFTNQNIQYRHQFNFSRRQYSYVNFSMLFQRHYAPNYFFTPRFHLPRPSMHLWQTNYNNIYKKFGSNNTRRHRVSAKNQHFDEIKKLAHRMKQLIINGNTREHYILIKSLRTLIQTYNSKYKTRLRLSADFNIIVDETIVDTIELDDDEEPNAKRQRTNSHDRKDDNFNMLKKLASQLNELEKKNKSSARHRRAFSKLLKTFNESYNEEYVLNESYELENRQQITLDSDSSSKEDIIEVPNFKPGKKLRNPFNILKRLSEKQNELNTEASTSRMYDSLEKENKYSETLINTFGKDWLPPLNDFGRAEIVSQEAVNNEIMDLKREEFLFDFLKIQNCKSDNWLQLKKSFFTSIEKTIAEFQNGAHSAMSREINSIVKPEDCTDIASVLRKLRIIRTETGIREECNLAIDFDVYNRDVQNFRKTKRPTPHFRIICLDESNHIPSGSEIASLHSKYDDQVIIVFAIVGVDSISYMQINPTDLPEYISNNT